MSINIQNKNLVFTVLLSSIVIGGAKIINAQKKKNRLSEMGAQFDRQDKQFLIQQQMKRAFRERNKDKQMSSQDVLSAFYNMRKQSDF